MCVCVLFVCKGGGSIGKISAAMSWGKEEAVCACVCVCVCVCVCRYWLNFSGNVFTHVLPQIKCWINEQRQEIILCCCNIS